MTINILKKIYLLSAIILICVGGQPKVSAAQYTQVSLDDSEFLLLDVTLQQKRLLASIEAYQVDEQTLLPASLIISSLGAGANINLTSNSLVYTNTGVSQSIELTSGINSALLEDRNYLWAKDDFELYISHLLLAQLINGSIDVQYSRLSVNLKSIGAPFPIEKNWARSGSIVRSNAKDEVKVLYVPDVYQLLTPPSADVSVSIGQQRNNDVTGAFNVQTHSDILYHSANISLHKSIKNSKITSRVNFTRHQSTPDTPLFGGLNQYSFGDISSGGSSLFNNSSSGLGLRFSRQPKNVSKNFGTQNIEGNATPGWDIELHYNGFLVESKTVPDNGYYLFEDVVTEYGNNHFEVRLYGPYGEEEVRKINFNIRSNWLPKGEFSYTGYILDRNKTLLDGPINNNLTETDEDAGFSFDYSPFNNTHIGWFYQHIGSQGSLSATQQESRQYVGTHVQSALNNLVLDIEYVKQKSLGHQLTAQGIGQFPWGQNYNVVLREKKEFSTSNNIGNSHDYQASFSTGGILPFKRGIGYRAGLTFDSGKNKYNNWLLNSSFSWRLSKLHFSNTLNYRVNDNPFESDVLAGNFTTSSTIGTIRIRGTANYVIEPDSYLTNFNVGASWRSSPKTFHNFNAGYSPKSKIRTKENWNASYTYSTAFEQLQLFSTADISDDNQWAIHLGINFFFDYDAHNQKFIMSSSNSSAAGHLNITSYLDRNDNNRRDEGDWLLENVGFSPVPAWQNRTTNQFGQVTLSGVPVYNPVTFTANPDIDVSTKNPHYTIYTHPGSRVNIELPFTIKTSITGFVEINSPSGQRALTSGTIVLTNRNTGITTDLMIDIDGFYEAPPLNAGHYSLQIAGKDLARLNLVALDGLINFVTPAQGGDYEIPLITLVRAIDASQVNESTTIVLNEDNGEAFYFGDDINAANMYAKPWEPRVALNGKNNKTLINSTPNYLSDSAQPLVELPPSESGNDAMKNESKRGVATNLSMNQKPSSIASDAALRAEAAGTLIIASTENDDSEPSQQEADAIAERDNILPTNSSTTYYTVQVGAFGAPANANRWLQRHDKIAFDCVISRPKNFDIIDCGHFNTRSDALSYQRELARQYGVDSTMIKTMTGAALIDTPNTSNEPVFTIQLLVASNQRTIDTFIVRHQLSILDINTTDKIVNGKALIALSFGRFSTKASATEAIKTLPSAIQGQTWVTLL